MVSPIPIFISALLQCLIEAVTIVDIICKQDSSYVCRAVSFLKILHSRICGDATYARALLPIAQFFLNHSKSSVLPISAQPVILALCCLPELVIPPCLCSGVDGSWGVPCSLEEHNPDLS